MRDRGELLEWAEVHGNLYGTPRQPVEAALAAGRDVLFDIDWQGTRQIAEALPDDIVRIFVLPPSMAELRARLERRAEDGADVIGRRLANARLEIRHWRRIRVRHRQRGSAEVAGGGAHHPPRRTAEALPASPASKQHVARLLAE